jgi:hypothetical protein
MSAWGIRRQARRLARLPNPQQRLAAGERLAELLETIVKRQESTMRPFYTLVIHYTNGSEDRLPFDQFTAVRDKYQHGISYSGGRVRRVEVDMSAVSGGLRAIWDISWTEESQRAGLQS